MVKKKPISQSTSASENQNESKTLVSASESVSNTESDIKKKVTEQEVKESDKIGQYVPPSFNMSDDLAEKYQYNLMGTDPLMAKSLLDFSSEPPQEEAEAESMIALME